MQIIIVILGAVLGLSYGANFEGLSLVKRSVFLLVLH